MCCAQDLQKLFSAFPCNITADHFQAATQRAHVQLVIQASYSVSYNGRRPLVRTPLEGIRRRSNLRREAIHSYLWTMPVSAAPLTRSTARKGSESKAGRP